MSFLILSIQVMRGRPILRDPSGIQLSACFARLPSSILHVCDSTTEVCVPLLLFCQQLVLSSELMDSFASHFVLPRDV